jgi:hypothetical protein
MVQIVDHASDAFDCASKNMGSIRMQTGIMFGKQGHVGTFNVTLVLLKL